MVSYAGENRGLVYQVVDKKGDVFWEEEIYLGKDLRHTYFNLEGKDFPNDFPRDLEDSVMLGTPNLMVDKEIPIFTPENEKFILQEPSGGFFSLSYQYQVPHLTSTAALEELSQALIINLYPEDNACNTDILSLEGEISGVSGVLTVEFPHTWLDRERLNSEEYLLIIQDQTGSFYKEIRFQFNPSG
jgi:hypothetical protein